jgi:glutamine synthetase
LRAKTLIIDSFDGNYKNAPMWIFDGSSTNQANSVKSDLHLKPVFCVKDPLRKGNAYLILCEVVLKDG